MPHWDDHTSLAVGLLSFATILAMLHPNAVSAEISLGKHGALAGKIDSNLRASSNILLNNDEEQDFIASVTPSILYRRDQGYGSIDAALGYRVTRYQDNDQFDSEALRSTVRVRLPDEYDGENYQAELIAGYNESTEANADVQNVVEKALLTIDLNTTFFLSEHYGLRTGINYRDEDAKTSGFADVEETSLPLALYYRYDEALSFGFGYRYRDSESSGGNTKTGSEDHAVFMGVEDLISPLVQYDIRIGAQQRRFSGDRDLDDETSLYANMELTWFFTKRSSLITRFGNEFGTTIGSQSSETLFFELQAIHRFDERLRGTVGARYEDITFQEFSGERDDEDYRLFASLDYSVIENRFILGARLQASERDSNSQRANYSAYEGSVNCTFIY